MANKRDKYCDKTVDTLLRLFEAGANDEEAAKAVGITTSTLYSWYRKYKGLKEKVLEAKDKSEYKAAENLINKLEECRTLAEIYVWKLLKGEITKTKTKKDGSGKVIYTETEQIHPSERILERFLPKVEGEDTTFIINFGAAEEED